MMKRIKENRIKCLILLMICLMIPCLVEKYAYPNSSFLLIRFIIVFLICIFCSTFFIFDWKKEISFIFKNRYIFGLTLFLCLVIFGFHGSSISIYNQAIQGNNNIESANSIFGQARTIRGDEWAVSTPIMLSQIKNNFRVKNRILNAYNANVSLYPKIITKSFAAISIPNQLAFLFLPVNQAFSFYWYFGYFLLFFGCIEFFMIITKNNKLYSVAGAILITFSPLVQWFESWNIIAYGLWAIVAVNHYFKVNSFFKKFLLSLLIGLIGICYVMTLYPAWQVPYSYFFLIMIIWVIIENYKTIKIRDLIFLVVISFSIIGIVVFSIIKDSSDIYFLISNTSYPGRRFITGGNGWEKLISYFACIFNSYKESSNPCEMSQFISLYPVPIILGLYHSIKNKFNLKKNFLVISLSCLAVLLSIWNFVKLPSFIAKITLIYMSTTDRCAIVVGFISIVLLIICLSQYHHNNKGKISYKYLSIALLIVFIGVYVNRNIYSDYFSKKMVIFDLLFFVPVITLCLINTVKTNRIAIILLSLLTLVTGINVHPLNRNIDVIYNKPIAKQISKLENKKSNSVWIMNGNLYYLSNYMVANGADTINSTNFYPINSLWKKLDLTDKKNIYNRYAHLLINITTKDTTVKLNYADQIELNLNIHDLCKLNVEYVLSTTDELEKINDNYIKTDKIYNQDGIYIYMVKCSNE